MKEDADRLKKMADDAAAASKKQQAAQAERKAMDARYAAEEALKSKAVPMAKIRAFTRAIETAFETDLAEFKAVAQSGDKAALKKMYRELVLKYHPDRLTTTWKVPSEGLKSYEIELEPVLRKSFQEIADIYKMQ